MMKPDPMPQPVLMNTVALRAVSIALRAGKVLASCASRPLSACAVGPADDGACGAAPICAAPVAAAAGTASVAGAIARPRRKDPASGGLRIAGGGGAPPPKTASGGPALRPPGRPAEPARRLGEFAEKKPAHGTFV